MENFSAILRTVWRPAQKNSWGVASTPPPDRARVNPISGRLLATPISGKGGCLEPPFDISGSYWSIFKIQTTFVSPQHDLHF